MFGFHRPSGLIKMDEKGEELDSSIQVENVS